MDLDVQREQELEMLKQGSDFERLSDEDKEAHERRFIHDFEVAVGRVPSDLRLIDAQNIRPPLTADVQTALIQWIFRQVKILYLYHEHLYAVIHSSKEMEFTMLRRWEYDMM